MFSYELWRHKNNLPDVVILKKSPSMQYVKLFRTNLEGGEGILYRLENNQNYIAKILKSRNKAEKKAEKINAFIELFKELTKANYWNHIFENNITMPRARLYTDDGVLAGFLMNYINLKKSIPLKVFIEIKYRKYTRWNDWFVKLYIAKKLVDIIKELHRIGIVVGDLNTNNIFIKSNAQVVVLDCDSMQLTYKGKTYPVDAILLDIAAPEVIREGQRAISIKSDVFTMAIHIYRIIMEGYSPFQFRSKTIEDRNSIILQGKNIFNNPYPPIGSPPLDILGPYLLEVLPKCLNTNPQDRPFLDELSTALYLTIKDLKVCENKHITIPYLGKCYICGSKKLYDFDKNKYI